MVHTLTTDKAFLKKEKLYLGLDLTTKNLFSNLNNGYVYTIIMWRQHVVKQ